MSKKEKDSQDNKDNQNGQDNQNNSENQDAVKVLISDGQTEVVAQKESIIVLRVKKPMATPQYEELTARIRAENEASGLKIVLVSAIVDGVEIREPE